MRCTLIFALRSGLKTDINQGSQINNFPITNPPPPTTSNVILSTRSQMPTNPDTLKRHSARIIHSDSSTILNSEIHLRFQQAPRQQNSQQNPRFQSEQRNFNQRNASQPRNHKNSYNPRAYTVELESSTIEEAQVYAAYTDAQWFRTKKSRITFEPVGRSG